MEVSPSDNILQYHGRLGTLYVIWLKNLALNILTLGIYRPWAKTNYRKYCYQSFSIAGDKPEYFGTGGELWRGMIKANFLIFALYMALYIPIFIAFEESIEAPKTPEDSSETPLAEVLSSFVIIPVIWAMYYLSKFSALRYRITRTRWRGIRGSMHGWLWRYVGWRFMRFFINVITLGFALGRSNVLNNRILINDCYIGDKKFELRTRKNSLDKINAITLILAPFTFFLSRHWFKAAALNAKYNNLSLGNVKFSSRFSGDEMVIFSFTNLLILIFTLFIGLPIVIHRAMKFYASNVQITGDVEEFKQSLNAYSSNFGEGVDDYFDSDGIDLDFGLI